MKNRIWGAEDLYQMVVACYFTGKCKSCPFWKLDKTSPTGRCLGRETVGTAFLDFLEILIDAAKEKKQPTLFPAEEGSAASDTADQEAGNNPVIPLEELSGMIGERLWLCENGTAALYRIVRMNTDDSEYVILSHCATDMSLYRRAGEYGVTWELRREYPE